MADAAARKSTMYPVVMAAAGALSMHTTDVDIPLFRETVPIEVPEIWRGFDACEHEPTE